jgi:uncharacterized protein (DUF1778 family)
MPESRPINLVVRVSTSEKKAIEKAAAFAHLDGSPWIRAVLLREAERQIAQSRKGCPCLRRMTSTRVASYVFPA